MFGEIDCREGMLLAVERYYYDTLHDAMLHTVGCFVCTLKKVLAKKKFKVLSSYTMYTLAKMI